MATNLYIVVGPSSGWSDPTNAEIVAGHLSGGGAATWAGNAAWTGSGQYLDATGLSAATAYKAAAVVYDGSGYSNVVVSAAFTTLVSITAAILHAGVGALGLGQTKSILPAGVGYMG